MIDQHWNPTNNLDVKGRNIIVEDILGDPAQTGCEAEDQGYNKGNDSDSNGAFNTFAKEKESIQVDRIGDNFVDDKHPYEKNSQSPPGQL